jgi:hypothetical protein
MHNGSLDFVPEFIELILIEHKKVVRPFFAPNVFGPGIETIWAIVKPVSICKQQC